MITFRPYRRRSAQPLLKSCIRPHVAQEPPTRAICSSPRSCIPLINHVPLYSPLVYKETSVSLHSPFILLQAIAPCAAQVASKGLLFSPSNPPSSGPNATSYIFLDLRYGVVGFTLICPIHLPKQPFPGSSTPVPGNCIHRDSRSINSLL